MATHSEIPHVDAAEAYRVAALFDGARRAAQVALSTLALDDAIDLGRDIVADVEARDVVMGQVLAVTDLGLVPTTARATPPTIELHPIEQTALELLGSDRLDVETVLFELRRAPAMHELIGECLERGWVRRNGARAVRTWATRATWTQRVPVRHHLVDPAERRILLAVHGPALLFEVAPDIPLAVGVRRRPREASWMVTGEVPAWGLGDVGLVDDDADRDDRRRPQPPGSQSDSA